MILRAFAIIALAAGGVLLGASAADAHASYVRSNPAADARLQRAPKEVGVAFSEPPDARASEIAVLDASGGRVDQGDTQASDEPNGLRVSLADVGDGGYVVAWTVLSTVDGHLTRGSFAFAVGDAPLPLADVSQASPPPRPLEVAGRALSFAGIALLIGGPLYVLALRKGPTPAEERRERLFLTFGGALLVVGAGALLVDQGGRAPPRLTALLAARGVAGVVALAAAAALAQPRRVVGLVAGLGAALSATLVSHAAASDAVAQVALDLAHVAAASAWAGGVAAMLAVTLPSARTFTPVELGRIVGRFSTFAVLTVAALSLTGIVQALLRLGVVQDLWETPYGAAVLAKSALLAVALAFAAFTLLRWGPRLRAAREVAQARRWLGRDVAGEAIAVVLILTATGLLTAFGPPAQPSGAAFDQTRHAEGLRLQLLLATVSPGRNRYVLRVHEGLSPVTDALKVAFRVSMLEHDMGESELVAEQRAPGEYVAAGNVTAMQGTWRVEAIIRRPERADVATTFAVPLRAPFPAAARIVQAPPYTLVVSVDPPQPVAGAPVTLNVVLSNAKGDPVPGKPLRVTLRGPGSETVEAAETSVGRYDSGVPTLEEGRWTATIAIANEAKGEYAFDVARGGQNVDCRAGPIREESGYLHELVEMEVGGRRSVVVLLLVACGEAPVRLEAVEPLLQPGRPAVVIESVSVDRSRPDLADRVRPQPGPNSVPLAGVEMQPGAGRYPVTIEVRAVEEDEAPMPAFRVDYVYRGKRASFVFASHTSFCGGGEAPCARGH